MFSLIPALEHAEFVRYGVMHRNTYINAPGVLEKTFRVKGEKTLYIAGQLSGVEGYVESIMSGLIASQALASELDGRQYNVPSDVTIIGSLCEYVATRSIDFKPMNANFGILPPIEGIRDKSKRKQAYHDRAMEAIELVINN